MTPTPPIEPNMMLGIAGVALMVAAAATGVGVLRAAGFPSAGRAVVAGALAGVLLGPTVLGMAWPERFEALYLGGQKQRAALEYARFMATAAPQALTTLDDEARRSMVAQWAEEVAHKQAALDQARHAHQQPMRLAVMALAAIVLLIGAMRCAGRPDPRQQQITQFSVGAWSFALPAAVAYVCAMRWWDATIAEAAMLAASVGIGPWALSVIERDAADGAELGGARMMQVAGRVASCAAIAVATWSAWRQGGWMGVLSVAPLGVMIVGWVLARSRPASNAAGSAAEAGHSLAAELLIASLAASVAMQINLHSQVSWTMIGMIVALSLLADDGRWLGAFFGAMVLGGRSALRTMRLVMPAMAAGPTQLVVAALAIHSGLLPVRFALPLLAGVLLIDLTAPARRSMTQRLIEAEGELS